MQKCLYLKEYLKEPPIGIYILTCLITIGTILVSVLSFVFNFFDNPYTLAIAIICYFIALNGIVYCVYLTFKVLRNYSFIKKNLLEWAKNYDFTFFILKNYDKRAMFFMFYFFLMSVCYAAFNLYLGIATGSIWYYSLAGYHISFTLLRTTILSYHNKKRKQNKIRTKLEDQEAKAKVYLTCGILLVVIDIALTVSFLEILIHNEHHTYFLQNLTIYYFAFYTIYKIIRAIINFIRSRHQKDLAKHAERCFCLTGACLSVLTLQTALLHKFNVNGAVNARLLNGITGSLVLIVTLSMGIFMIIRAKRHLKKIRKIINNQNKLEK